MTSDLLVIVPSRGRPQNIERLTQAWIDTGAEAQLQVAVDDDDPTLDDYLSLDVQVTVGPRLGMIGTLNDRAVKAAGNFSYAGFAGDDHVPRTAKWDKTICAELDDLGTGIVYGNDLLQRGNLPTAVFLTSDIVRTLGYMAPPHLQHLFADNFWLDCGRAVDRIKYLDAVVIEHVHWLNGKAPTDAGYDEVNSKWGPDSAAYDLYKSSGQFDTDVAKIRALL